MSGLRGVEAIVIGAGVAGLALALALRNHGADVLVLEQSPAITEVGAGLQISPNGAVVLHALGLGADLTGAGQRAHAVVLRNSADARQVIRLDLPADGAGFHLLHRADLIAMLENGARAAGVEIRTGTRVASVLDHGGGAALSLGDGTMLRARLIIGADGLHSLVRPVLNGSETPFFTGQTAWRAVIPGDPQVPAQAEVFMGPGRHLVSYPLRGGHLRNIVAIEERRDWTAEGWHHPADPDALRAAFAPFGGPVPDWLAAVGQVWIWGLFRHEVARRWQGGALALVGDAAHPTLPFMAQGANLALEDAWVLAQALAAQRDMATALAGYQSARRDRAASVIKAANRNARNFHLRAPLRPLAHAALRLAGRIAPGAALARHAWIHDHDVTRG